MDIPTLRGILQGFKEAEEIDLRHGFRLPGDSAIYIYLWGLETILAESDQREAEVALHVRDLTDRYG